MKSEKRTEYIQKLISIMKKAGMRDEEMVGLFYETNEAKMLDWLQMLACMEAEGKQIGKSEILKARMMIEIEPEDM